MQITNQTRREVMTLAWQKLRCERRWARSKAYSMAQALRHAWAWVKGALKRTAEEAATQAAWIAADCRIIHLRSPVTSPTRRGLGARPYAGVLARQAAYATARLGY